MATIEELSAALVKADAAGDTAGAKALADAIRSAQGQRQRPVPEDPNDGWLQQALSGVNEGIGNTLGAPVDIASMLINLGTGGANAMFGTEIPAITDPFLGSSSIKGMMGGAIKPESEDGGKQFMRRVMQDVGASAIPVLGTVGKAAQPVRMAVKELGMGVGSGVGAAAAQQAFPGNPYAEMVGQILGGGAAAVGASAAKKVVTPFPASPERLAAADKLASEGVELTAGQRTGSESLKYAESELGGARAGAITEQQAEQFTKAALSRIGSRADRATPEVLSEAYKRLGSEFESIGARNRIQADQQMADDLKAAWQDYASVTAPSDRAPAVENFIRDIATAIRDNNGVIDGKVYTRLRSRIGELSRSVKDPDRKGALLDIQAALDDAMERNMSPDDAADFAAARRQYRDFIVIEQAATGAGESAAMGIISPAALRQATVTKLGRRNYALERGSELSGLARSGVASMSPLPQSGTAPRTAARNIGMAIPTMVGAGVGSAGGFAGAAAGAAAGALTPAVIGRLMLSEAGRKYLSNQLLKGKSGASGVAPLTAVLSDQSSDNRKLTAAQQRFLELIAPKRGPVEITVTGGAR